MTISLQILQRLSSTNFTWSDLECFVPFVKIQQHYSRALQTNILQQVNICYIFLKIRTKAISLSQTSSQCSVYPIQFCGIIRLIMKNFKNSCKITYSMSSLMLYSSPICLPTLTSGWSGATPYRTNPNGTGSFSNISTQAASLC